MDPEPQDTQPTNALTVEALHAELADMKQTLSERTRSEKTLQRAYDDLAQRMEARTTALTVSYQVLQSEITQRQFTVRQLLTAQEAERLRIARDLHDQLGQQITALQLGLKRLELPAQGTPVAEMLPALQALAQQMAIDAHHFAVNLRPTILDDMGLAPALERLVADWSEQTRISGAFQSVTLEQRLPGEVETTLYRIIQEALTNVRKYAQASNVSVVVERRDREVVAIIEDNGRGFDVEATPTPGARPQLGLVGMRERAALLGGTVEIESSPGHGTTVFVRISLDGVESPEGPRSVG